MKLAEGMTDAVNVKEPGKEASFYLADWYVDTRANRLSRGETEVKLESKVMAVLAYLVQHRGELVTRDELEQAIWGKVIVGYESLTGCIAKLRKVLGDDARRPRYIETISKKGYRLVAEVTGVDRSAATSAPPPGEPAGRDAVPPRRRRVVIGAAAVLLVLAGTGLLAWFGINTPVVTPGGVATRPSIVVLPFVNLSDDPEDHYFSDGVTADLTTALSKLSGLLVVGQSASSGYRYKPTASGEIAESLGVRYVLEGSVRRTRDRLRVSAHLLDTESNLYLWSEKYDRDPTDLFEVQDEITGNIVTALSVKLTEQEKRRTASRYTVSFAAYDDFLRGQAHYMRHTREDYRRALGYYQQAIDRDPAFARAYSAMALARTAEYRRGWADPGSDQLDQALRLAQRGVELDGDLPQTQWALSYVYLFRKDYDKANEVIKRAIELDPNFADSYLNLAVCKIHFGQPEEALGLVHKAMLLNPEYPAAYASVLGQAYYFQGQYAEAVPVLRDALERNLNLLIPHVFLVAALSKQGRLEEARWAATQLKTVAADFTADNFSEILPFQDDATLEDMRRHLKQAGL